MTMARRMDLGRLRHFGQVVAGRVTILSKFARFASSSDRFIVFWKEAVTQIWAVILWTKKATDRTDTAARADEDSIQGMRALLKTLVLT